MKYSTLIAAIPLLHLAVAQPHRRRHLHEHQLAKKADVVVTVIDTIYAEATDSPKIIVYVDLDGKPVCTENVDRYPMETPAPAAPVAPPPVAPPPPPPPPAPVAPVAPVPPPPPPPPAPVAPAPVAPAPAPVGDPPVVNGDGAPAPVVSDPAASAPEPVKTTDMPAGGSAGYGLVYSPYNADGTCKTPSQVGEDFKSISTEYTLIRTYGTDCDQVASVLPQVKARKNKLFAGIFDIVNLESQVQIIIKAANGDWSSFDTISVGNELVNSGAASASAVVAAIGTVRALLKAAGYTGNVVTVDTLVASRQNPSLCHASDFCAVNCHPFFDGKVAAADSGNFLTTQIPTLQAVLANKSQKVVVTETGWPWKGDSNGAAVASLPNQEAAIISIKTSFASNPESVILFTAFNDLWKKNTPAQFDAEQFWGIGGRNAPSG